MPIQKAAAKGYLKGSQQDIEAAIDAYRKRASVMEYKVTAVSVLEASVSCTVTVTPIVLSLHLCTSLNTLNTNV